ncbi:phosphotransferase enzyme family protein [Fictibacillus halophilus]|uniref:phosphotransferase enzyme family protein n=1 Tax=Fictibacillus halophilus TaxID=1610490 RepID=UPI003643EC9C
MQLTDKKVLQEASVRFGISNELKELSEGFQNLVYSYNCQNKEYILRITPAYKKNRNQIEAELHWVKFLKNNGVSVSGAIPSQRNVLVEEVHVNNQIYCITSFEKAVGRPVDVNDERVWNPHLFKEWGRLLGEIHCVGKSFRVSDQKTKRLKWELSHPYNHELFLDIPQNWLDEKYKEIVDKLMTFSKDDDHFGLIHNDFHQGNFFVEEGKITVFDFDDCSYFWFAYDIATAFYHAYWQHNSFNSSEDDFAFEFLTHFLNGYRSENKLTDNMIEQLPAFLKLRELFLYVLFLQVWNHDNLQDWQNYTLNNLKTNIVNGNAFANLHKEQLVKIKQRLSEPL